MKVPNKPRNAIDAKDATNVFELICRHCDLAVRTTDALALYLSSGSKEVVEQINEIGSESEQQRSNSLAILRRKFPGSPFREQTHLAIDSTVEIIHYARTTVREMDMLRVGKDEHTKQLGALIQTGTRSIGDGYARLAGGATDVEQSVETARRVERDAGDAYRSALSDLFDPGSFLEFLDAKERNSDIQFLGHYLRAESDRHGAAAKTLAYVANIFRHREVLRHLSNTADRVLHASNVLDEFSVQVEVDTTDAQGSAE